MRQEGIYAKLGRSYQRKKAVKREIESTENLLIKEQIQTTRINQVWYLTSLTTIFAYTARLVTKALKPLKLISRILSLVYT